MTFCMPLDVYVDRGKVSMHFREFADTNKHKPAFPGMLLLCSHPSSDSTGKKSKQDS